METRRTVLHFKSTAEMLDCLTTLPTSAIPNIRQIRLKSFPFPVKETKMCYSIYFMGEVLPLFPGLALDLITAEDPYHDFRVEDVSSSGVTGTYSDIQTLIESNGWKELHYFATTEFLWDRMDNQKPQPAGWDKLLKEKDGEDSGAEVRMYVAKEWGLSAADVQTRKEFKATPGRLLPDFDDAWESDDEVEYRQVLVVAKRGRNAAYVQNGSDLEEKMKDLWSRMSWQEIKESGRYVPPEENPCSHI